VPLFRASPLHPYPLADMDTLEWQARQGEACVGEGQGEGRFPRNMPQPANGQLQCFSAAHFQMPDARAVHLHARGRRFSTARSGLARPPEQHELPGPHGLSPHGKPPSSRLKLALLAQSPNGATFLPRIRVLGRCRSAGNCSPRLWHAHGCGGGAGTSGKRAAVPPAFDELERRFQLAALVMNASQSLLGTSGSRTSPVHAHHAAPAHLPWRGRSPRSSAKRTRQARSRAYRPAR